VDGAGGKGVVILSMPDLQIIQQLQLVRQQLQQDLENYSFSI
jgi:hypothetical protein